MTDHHNQQAGSRETQKLGSVLEFTISCLFGKHGIEIRIWFLSEDNTQSWVGSNKFLMDSKNNDHRKSWWFAWRTSVTTEDFCMPIEGKSKTSKKRTCWLFTEHHSDERKEVDRNKPGNYSLSAYDVSKKVIHLFRHSQKVQREDDGVVQFWRIKEHLQSQFVQIPFRSDNRWKACLVGGGGAKRRCEYCSDVSELFEDIQDAIFLILHNRTMIIHRGFFFQI